MIVKTQPSIYLLNAGVQDSNNYMFRPFIVAIIKLYIPSSKSMYNKQWHTQDFFWGGVSTNSVEDRGQRERGSRGSSPLVRGSGGSCNLVQEISFHMVKFS